MRTTSFAKFGQKLSDKMHEIINDGYAVTLRIYRINSPQSRGDVIIVLESGEWDNRQALTYRADGTWSGLSYWCEDQI